MIQMTLRTRFCLVLGAFCLVLTAAALLLAQALLIHGADDADRERALEVLSRGQQLLVAETDSLLRTTRDWAAWDDTYAFVTDRNEDYITSNLVPSTLTELRLQAIVCMNTNKEVVAKLVEMPEEQNGTWLMEELQGTNGLAARVETHGAAAGLLSRSNQLWLIAIAPVLTSDDEGPARGTLLMMRSFGEAEIQRLADFAHPSLSLRAASKHWPVGRTKIDKALSNSLIAQTAIADIYGSGRILIQASLPRRAHSQATAGLLYLTAGIAICGAAIALIAFLLVNRWVLRSITDSVNSLKAAISTPPASPDKPPRLHKVSTDEIGELVDAVDHALGAFEETRREAEQRRKEAMQAQKLAALGTLVAGVAHEVNNPNNVIALNARLIERALGRTLGHDAKEAASSSATSNAMGEELTTATRAILGAAERITGLIDALKAFARPTSQQLTDPVSVPDLVERAASWVSHEMSKHGCVLQLEVGERIPPVRGDSQQLLQVLINLLQNACQAGTGSTTIRVVVAHDAKPNEVVIRVIDTGQGIPAEHLQEVLDPFFTLRRAEGGTGLGLSISDTIVRAHGGTMHLDSSEGEGTTVTVRLPAIET